MLGARDIASFASGIQYENIPKAVIEKMKISLLYNLSQSFLGKKIAAPVLKKLFELERKNYDGQDWISANALTIDHAVYMNACLITARGQNETIYEAFAHTGCVIIPCALALSEMRRISGKELLAALVAGYESTAAIADGVAAFTTEKGFRSTSLYSPFGAAITSAKLLGLNAEQMMTAIALISNFNAGTMQTWRDGTDEWLFQVGNGSKNGILSAIFASDASVSGSENSLEGPAGFYHTHAAGMEFTRSDWLGTDWRTLTVQYKPYPGCALNQLPMFCALSLLNNYRVASEELKAVTVYLNPAEHNYPGIQGRAPFNGRGGAIMSLSYAMALCFCYGNIQNDYYDRYTDEKLLAFMDKVKTCSDESLDIQSVKIDVVTMEGRIYTEELSLQENNVFLFNWEQTVQFAENLLPEMSITKERMDRLIEAISKLDQFEDASQVVSILLSERLN